VSTPTPLADRIRALAEGLDEQWSDTEPLLHAAADAVAALEAENARLAAIAAEVAELERLGCPDPDAHGPCDTNDRIAALEGMLGTAWVRGDRIDAELRDTHVRITALEAENAELRHALLPAATRAAIDAAKEQP
jgi:predicted  nucleic acid-binding Zn-ribbon protein